jgi:hypothetical protein
MVNVQSFMDVHELDPQEVAKELFPTNAYPVMALKRILTGEALLDSDQIQKLAHLAGVGVEKVFNKGWSRSTDRSENGPKYILTSGSWRAEIDRMSWVTRLFHNDRPVVEEIISKPTVGLVEYINDLELAITRAEFNNP